MLGTLPNKAKLVHQIDLPSFISHFEGRANELLVQYENARLQHERDTHNMVTLALENANASLQYLLENVSGFKELFEEITDSAPSPFGDNVIIAMSESCGSFLMIRQFGFANTEGAVSVGINNGKIILTTTAVSHEQELAYERKLDSSFFKYLDSKALREELDRYCSPMRLLEALLLKRFSL